MDFEELLQIVGDAPLFETGLLLVGDVDPANVRRQLSRWTAAGKLLQLRRGLYTLAPPYQKTAPHAFLVANYLVQPSYVSLQAALAHAGLIPEYAAEVTSVTTGRPAQVETPLGRYTFRHVKTSRFYGYRRLDVGGGQRAFVARPEKALLDQIYLQPEGETLSYLRGLRLQNLERLNMDVLHRLAARAESPKLERAAVNIATLITEETEDGYEILSENPG
jgi:predicted transcriptional regulator of viral defense system